MKTKKHIVIAGAGFGGLNAAKHIYKRLGQNVELTVIDSNDFHLFTPNLFEVATADDDLTRVGELREHIAVPLARVFQGTGVKFVKGTVVSVDQAAKQIRVGHKIIAYDELVLALGSVSDFYGIAGAQTFSLPLKTLEDALRIRNRLEFAFQLHRQDPIKNILRIVVAGGGYTGVEFAAELARELPFLAWKNSIPREKIHIEIVEGQNSLIPNYSEPLSRDALLRLSSLGVAVRLNSKIASVNEHFIEFNSGERETYDVLVWTTGVRAREMAFARVMPQDNRGRILVNEHLLATGDEHVYALGDMALVLGTDGKPVPCSAQDAWRQGQYLAYVFECLFYNKKPKPYIPQVHGFVVSMGGKWGILDHKGLYLKGLLGYIGDLFAHFRYYRSIIGTLPALKQVWGQWRVFGRNDM